MRDYYSTNSDVIWMSEFFGSKNIRCASVPHDPKDYYDVAILTAESGIKGARKLNPEFYGDKKLFGKLYDEPYYDVGILDRYKLLKDAVTKGKKTIATGISATVAAIMAGAEIVQEVDDHMEIKDSYGNANKNYEHQIYFADLINGTGKPMYVPSEHTDMMYPFNMDREDYSIIAWGGDDVRERKEYAVEYSYRNELTELIPPSEADYFGGEYADILSRDFLINPEVIYFRNINTLAIQYDPEQFFGKKYFKPIEKATNKIIKAFLDNKL